MTKICHLTIAHEYNDVRIFSKECLSLQKFGYEVCIVAPNTIDHIESGIHIYGVKTSSHPMQRFFKGAKHVYQKALSIDADIYHFHDIELFKYGVKFKKKGKIVIFDSHEDWPSYVMEIAWLPNVVKKVSKHYIERLYRKHLPIFDAILTVSPHIVRSLSKYSSKVNMITNYPIINSNLKSEVREKEYLLRCNKICYAGTVYSNSNQVEIIRALETIDAIEYLIVGRLSEESKLELSKLQGWSKVKYIQTVPKDVLVQLYQTVLAGIVIFDYSSNCGGKEGTMGNNKIFEYMMEGLPIICTDFSCWENLIIRKYNCGICVTPNNVKNIQDAINFLIMNKHAAYKMGQNARRAVLEEFNWGTQEKKLIEIYHTLS